MCENDVSSTERGATWQLLLQLATPDGTAIDHASVERVTDAVRTLGLQPAVVKRIEQAVMEALGKATQREDWDQSRVTIRIWISDRSGAMDPLRSSLHTPKGRSRRRGGWGFFLVERQEGDPGTTVVKSRSVVELYLYRESSRARKGSSGERFEHS